MKRRLLLIGSLSLLAMPILFACGDDEKDTVQDASHQPDLICTPKSEAEAITLSCGTGEGQSECGTVEVADGCGGDLEITCPECGEGKICDDSNACVDDGELCTPSITAEEAKAAKCGEGEGKTECGSIKVSNGCQEITFDCGGCANDETCGLSGTCVSTACVPTLTEEEAQAAKCGTGAEQSECGTIVVDDGCAGLTIDCGGCAEGTCNSNNECVATCTPLTSNSGYAYYCNKPPTYWQCGGKIERDDLCGGTVMVNCGGDTACKNDTVCDMETLHCVKQECVPESETDVAFCSRYHSECGTASGEDSCGNVKTVTCSSCASGNVCVGSIGTSGSSTYPQQTCEPQPTTTPLLACTPTLGDTSANTATNVMSLGEGFTSYQYTAPEVIYAFTATTTGEVTVSATPWNNNDFDLVLYVVTSLSSRTALKLSDTGSYGQAESLKFNATSGTTYYVVVDGGDWASPKYDRGPFQIEIDDGNCVVPTGNVVITGIYGGGGSTNAPLDQDFIELHNQGSAEVDISGWTIFVGQSMTSSVWQKRTKTVPTNTKIAAGKYFLIGDTLGKTDEEIAQMSSSERAKYISRPNLEMGSKALKFGADEAKVFIAPSDVTPTGQCPTEEGLLVVYGDSYCGTPHTTSLGLSNWLYDHTGCANSLTREAVIQSGTTQKPRNSASPANVCP